MSHSRVRGINPATGNPYKREETIAAENAKHQNLHTKLYIKPLYTAENTGPNKITESFSQEEYGCEKNNSSCVTSGGKKSRKSHNSKKQRKSKKSKRSHTTKRSRR